MSTSHSEQRVVGAGAWDGVLDDLRKLRSYTEDWDGQGAAKPNAACVDAAVRWVQWMRDAAGDAIPPSAAVASPGGEVLLVWQIDGTYLEAEIADPESVEWMRYRKDGSVEQWESGFDASVS